MTPPGSSPVRARGQRWSTPGWLAAALVLVVMAVGLIQLPYYGDQALYAVIGREVIAGQPLYTGIWDIKQPGIFLWYGVLGGRPLVTRTADVLVAVSTAWLVAVLVRPHVPAVVARWTPVAAAAVLLLPVRALDLGQVEELITLPSLAALVLVARGRPPNRDPGTSEPGTSERGARRILLYYGVAGVLVGVVAVFKLWAAAVPLAAVLTLLVAPGGRTDGPPQRLPRTGALVMGAVGTALPVGAVLIWLAATGSLDAAVATWFVAPAEQLAQPGARTLSRLASGAGRYLLVTLPVVLLAAARLSTVWRRRDPLDLALIAWVGAGLAVIAVQLWWSYHWILLTPALLALAARQAGELLERPPARVRSRALVAALTLAAVPLLDVGLLSPERPLVLGDGLTSASSNAIDTLLGSGRRDAAELTAAGVTPGQSLYVLGDPNYQWEHGTPYPVRLNGWTPELFTDAQWDELAMSLATATPQWVFLENDTRQLTVERGHALLRTLDHDYVRTRSSDAGDWYRLDP